MTDLRTTEAILKAQTLRTAIQTERWHLGYELLVEMGLKRDGEVSIVRLDDFRRSLAQ